MSDVSPAAAIPAAPATAWTLTAHELPLRYVWKISRNASATKTNLVVGVRLRQRPGRAAGAGRGEAAPNVRYGESPALLQAQFEELLGDGLARVEALPDLTALLLTQPVAPALRFALEAALTEALAATARQPVWQWLGLPRPADRVPTAFSLPIMPPGDVAAFVRTHEAGRFGLLKVKVNADQGLDLLRAVAAALPGRALLVDGNETWPDADAVLQFLGQAAAVPGLRLRLLEQPLPAACADDYRYLRPRAGLPLIADESVTDSADVESIAQQFHGVNVKLMKAGGYGRGIELLRRTRAAGLLPMLGCMVETSLGIRAALHVSALAEVHDLDGSLILQAEPFGLVREADGYLSVTE